MAPKMITIEKTHGRYNNDIGMRTLFEIPCEENRPELKAIATFWI
jgi:hypothetical protein